MATRQNPPYLDTLAQFAADTRLGDISPGARKRARLILADCVPVVAAGMQQREMKLLVDRQMANAASGRCWVIGAGRRAGALDAALLNGTAGTWLELDEGNLFAKGHPGIQVVPAAISAAHELNAPGGDLLAAVTLGYELSSRISRAANVTLAVHPHGTYGVIGAAIAVAKLKKFTAPRMRELISASATMGMATSRQTLLDGATVRNIFTGHSGYMGLMAARLIECAFTGEVDGVGNVYGKVLSPTFDRDKVIEGLGSEWLIEKSYFKLHPVGRYAHSAFDALEDLLSRVTGGRLAHDSVAKIEVRSYMLAAILAEKNIISSFGARFSIPFGLASIIVHGGSGLRSFDDDAVANPHVQALTQLVDLREDEAHTKAYPAKTPCDICITLKDGTIHEGHCEVMKGEPSNPHSDADLRGKFFELGTPVWGEPVTRQVFDAFMDIESMRDFGAFADSVSL